MPPAVVYLRRRLAAFEVLDWRAAVSIFLFVALHASILVIMYQTETDEVSKAAFLLTWGALN